MGSAGSALTILNTLTAVVNAHTESMTNAMLNMSPGTLTFRSRRRVKIIASIANTIPPTANGTLRMAKSAVVMPSAIAPPARSISLVAPVDFWSRCTSMVAIPEEINASTDRMPPVIDALVEGFLGAVGGCATDFMC